MKTLFLIDGAYQAAKSALCFILHEKKNCGWALISKASTKPKGQQNIDMTEVEESVAKARLDQYVAVELTRQERCNRRWFCYKYPEIPGYSDTINCIDTYDIDNLIAQSEKPYGFLIVRDHQCINDLIYKYEQNGGLNVVPIFLYTDYTYISATADEEVIEKWNKLLRTYIWNYDYTVGKVNYERVLIFNGEKNQTIPSDMAINNLRKQFEELVKQVENKNKDLVVVTESERTFIPKEIREHKELIEHFIHSPEKYRKNVFLMMKFHNDAEKDILYQKISQAIQECGYNCIRADDNTVRKLFPDKNGFKMSMIYWLATFLCSRGVAVFEKDGDKFIINPNVAFEMGIMKQQGKHVDIFMPNDLSDFKERELFFDVKDYRKNRYCNEDDLIKKIKLCLHI